MCRGNILCFALLFAGCGAHPGSDATKMAVAESTETPASAIDRKIIYTAEIDLVVRDVSATENTMPQLVKEHGGYLGEASIDSTSGRYRTGRWTARVPVAQFEAFLDAVSKLGVPESRSQTAQDVTEEYVDLEARIANKQRLEKRILELLEGSEGKITDVIEVERELARVRGEIEQMTGRLRYLANRTDMTTVVIVAREQRDFVPAEAPTFIARTKQAWSNSLLSLRDAGATFVVVVVSVVPWLLTLLLLFLPLIWYLRRRFRSTRYQPDA